MYQCDECRPQCKRCHSYGIVCNFIGDVPDLEPAAGRGRHFVVQRRPDPQCPIDQAVWTSDASLPYRYQLNAKCQDFVTRYLGRSITTLIPDDPNMVGVNRQLLKIAFEVRDGIVPIISSCFYQANFHSIFMWNLVLTDAYLAVSLLDACLPSCGTGI